MQTFRSQLAKLDGVALEAMERVLKEDTKLNDATWRFIMRLYVRLRFPEEWKAGMAEAVEQSLPPTINATTLPQTSEVQELKRVIVEAVATYAKRMDAANGASHSPALPNANGELES